MICQFIYTMRQYFEKREIDLYVKHTHTHTQPGLLPSYMN